MKDTVRYYINQAMRGLKDQAELMVDKGYPASSTMRTSNNNITSNLIKAAVKLDIPWATVPSTSPPAVPKAYALAAPFSPGGKYSWMGHAPVEEGTEIGGSVRISRNDNGYGSTIAWKITPEHSNRTIVWNSTKATWEEWLPKWGVRDYNAYGLIENLTQYRCGDFHKGREGHAVYLNVISELRMANVHAVECGGNAIQLVWRAKESDVPIEAQSRDNSAITLNNVSATNCGAITSGSAVRASYPFSIFNPGQDILINGMKVRCNLPSFLWSGVMRRSHGGLVIHPGQAYRRTDYVEINGLDIEIHNSRRGLVKLGAIDHCVMRSPRVIDHGGENTVSIVDDCGVVEIIEPLSDLVVKIRSQDDDKVYKHVNVFAGSTYTFTGKPNG